MKRKNKKIIPLWVTTILFFCSVLLMFIRLKLIEGLDWEFALLGTLAFVGAVLLVCIALALLLFLIAEIRRRIRKRKVDRRIIRQAQAAGVWDKMPILLGGRALELKAWQEYKIKRANGETDKELRLRCMAAAGERPDNSTTKGR